MINTTLLLMQEHTLLKVLDNLQTKDHNKIVNRLMNDCLTNVWNDEYQEFAEKIKNLFQRNEQVPPEYLDIINNMRDIGYYERQSLFHFTSYVMTKKTHTISTIACLVASSFGSNTKMNEYISYAESFHKLNVSFVE